MKKFINDPETVTSEELLGLGLAFPEMLSVDGSMVISNDLQNAERVTIVAYGGSGHEPAQKCCVGRGMLDIQVDGDVFASPSGEQIFEALKRADKGHGVLLFTLNYPGDRLAGEVALTLAEESHINVRQIITADEIGYDPEGEDNKRGLAGVIPMYHIAAAAAERNMALDKIADICQDYADSMASITVKTTDATHPQNGMSFGDLQNTNLMEIGAGQHGEGGGVRIKMASSQETIGLIAPKLVEAVGLKRGDRVFVMINGLGATSMMELLILYKDAVTYLEDMGIEVIANMVGEILTVQEAGGFQMNVAKWTDETLSLWEMPAHTPIFFKE
jgi:dihydroxyacetone kinase-like protein